MSQEHLLFFVGTSLVLIGTFWIGVGFYNWVDRKKLFARHRIQGNRYASEKQVKKAARHILMHQIFILMPLLFLTYPLFAALGLNFSFQNWPPVWMIALQIVFFMFVEDFLFYWVHRTLHRPNLYKKIHKVHHEFVTPTAIASHYAHPIEFVVANSLPVMAGPLLVALFGLDMHIGVLWIWLFIRVLETMDGHSGYNFRLWFPHKLIYGAGAKPHDDHHSKFNGNFASFFHHWDKIHGSELVIKPRAAGKKPKPQAHEGEAASAS
jgi:sterol desaturase/sphingolipid hydroxylase (fatty acid hydroxylase superfamily)